ncbi:Hypothetical predicted protein [Paramuricea clavata]|uniref:Uncharacterized protein n=1 Tax=Paramuricea clavata TaxID=317549 RepID=A0A6S7K3A6_PARCT|nr:Hypothetical predicted protein [Paramuricea clavata]
MHMTEFHAHTIAAHTKDLIEFITQHSDGSVVISLGADGASVMSGEYAGVELQAVDINWTEVQYCVTRTRFGLKEITEDTIYEAAEECSKKMGIPLVLDNTIHNTRSGGFERSEEDIEAQLKNSILHLTRLGTAPQLLRPEKLLQGRLPARCCGPLAAAECWASGCHNCAKEFDEQTIGKVRNINDKLTEIKVKQKQEKELDEKIIEICEVVDIASEINEAEDLVSRDLDTQRHIFEKMHEVEEVYKEVQSKSPDNVPTNTTNEEPAVEQEQSETVLDTSASTGNSQSVSPSQPKSTESAVLGSDNHSETTQDPLVDVLKTFWEKESIGIKGDPEPKEFIESFNKSVHFDRT